MPHPVTILTQGPQPEQEVSPISEQNAARRVALNRQSGVPLT